MSKPAGGKRKIRKAERRDPPADTTEKTAPPASATSPTVEEPPPPAAAVAPPPPVIAARPTAVVTWARSIDFERVVKYLSFAAALVALVALGDLGLRSALRFDRMWDGIDYHIPFAALRGGLHVPFEMSERATLYYQGFPPLPEFVQGVLWRLTGTVHATGVVNYLAFAGFLLYCHIVLGARFWLVALIALTAPLVVIHAACSYIDLFANSFLAVAVASSLHLFLFRERARRAVIVGGLIGVVGAMYSKLQLVPLAGLFFVILTVLSVRRARLLRLAGWQIVVIPGVAGVIAALPYVKNLAVYGNPFWPVRVPFFASVFPYAIDAQAEGRSAERPPPLRSASQSEVFVNSLFEIDHPTHYSYRERWVLDQGNGWTAYRAGGFWVVGVTFYLLATLALFVVHDRRRGIAAGVCAGALLCFVAVLPQSNELRYYQFMPLAWAAAVGMTFPALRSRFPALAAALVVAVLALFGYMVRENSSYYQVEEVSWADVAKSWAAKDAWTHLKPGKTYCAVDLEPMAMLLTGPTATEFKIVARSHESLCPAGSSVIFEHGLRALKRWAPGQDGEDDTWPWP